MRHLHDVPSSQAACTVRGSIKVLLAAEPGDFAKSLRWRLEQDHCAVDIAVTKDDVLLMARRGYDIIFVDLETADVDALSVLRELKLAGASVQCPIVLIKGDDEPQHVVQRGLDLGAAGYIVKRRLPAVSSMTALLEAFGIIATNGPSKGAPALRVGRAGSDACPWSARGTFHECAAFMPINALVHAGSGLERVSCSHLRAGEAEAWRLYPRCAIGDPAARAKYVRDQTC